MDRIDSAYMDCVSDVVALLLAHAGVADVRTPFVYQWAFRVVGGTGGVLEPDLPPRARDRSVARFAGLRPKWSPIGPVAECVESWRHEIGCGNAVAVTADAYFLPWLPYFGKEHMEHGFVVEGVEGGREALLHVVDPYENRTRWGQASPTTTKITLGDLGHALDRGAWGVLEPCGPAEPLDPEREVRANCEAVLASHADGTMAAFAGQYRDPDAAALHRLALQSWLITRDRQLHALWLRELPGTPAPGFSRAFDETVLPRWQKLQEIAYVAIRRVEAGRAAPPAVHAALEAALTAEAELARTSLDHPEGSA
ncbi:hypothetical protein SAMN04489730_5170 [Amycolatopsis australiensis]|uniref:Butirosin biosynthesis protein H, N-terminal n=1 Tax=Amycolatopsis australiensis TaxID=546364 RepID=A0A1K1SBC1_9PSEU|nr:hypothetical protein SAMN04489730_5170 [Amycolatopsis australiensis]